MLRKNKKWIIIIIILVAIPTSMYGFVKVKHRTLQNETMNYLKDQGYKKADIQQIDVKLKKLSLFTAEVTFSDEPNISYDYKKEAGGDIIQIGPTLGLQDDYEFLHLE